MKNLFKLLIALLLLPTVFFAGVETVRGLTQALGDVQTALIFLAGILVYIGIHIWLYDFARAYVFAHEMTHAVAAIVCGYRIRDISVRQNSGYVKMDNCNTAVALAPYFIPAYTVLAGLIYGGISLFTDASAYRPVFIFLTGFLMTFHFVQTFKTLFETNQPDLKLAGGYVFSVVTIIFVNLVMLVLVLKILFPANIALLELSKNTVTATFNVWKIVINYIWERWINAA